MEGTYKLIHPPEFARAKMDTILSKREYVDLHSWCFAPSSFRLIIHDLHSLGMIPFKEVVFSPTTGCDFFIALSRNGSGLQRSRLDRLKMIESEVRDAAAV